MKIIRDVLVNEFRDPFAWKYCYHHGKTGQQKVAEQQTGTDITNQNNDVNQQQQLTGAAQGTLSQFEGPVQNSPFYKALLTSGIEGTSGAYDTARSNMKAQENQAGFGYNQPVAQGADNQLQAQEASDLAKVPNTAMTEAAPLSLSAAGTTANMGMGYGSQAQGWDSAAQGWNNSAYNMNQKRGSLFNTLLQSGMQAGQGLGEAAIMAG